MMNPENEAAARNRVGIRSANHPGHQGGRGGSAGVGGEGPGNGQRVVGFLDKVRYPVKACAALGHARQGEHRDQFPHGAGPKGLPHRPRHFRVGRLGRRYGRTRIRRVRRRVTIHLKAHVLGLSPQEQGRRRHGDDQEEQRQNAPRPSPSVGVDEPLGHRQQHDAADAQTGAGQRQRASPAADEPLGHRNGRHDAVGRGQTGRPDEAEEEDQLPRLAAETHQHQARADQHRRYRDVSPRAVAVDQPSHRETEHARSQTPGGLHPAEGRAGQRQVPLHGQHEEPVVQRAGGHRREVDGEHGRDDDPAVEDPPSPRGMVILAGHVRHKGRGEWSFAPARNGVLRSCRQDRIR